MASIDILNLNNEKVGTLELSDSIFGCEVKPHLLHAAVRVGLLSKRGGNASTKGRSEVRGGGAKPWKQKGTGNARSGTSSSPVWVGGGTVFGPKPKKYGLTLNKKVKKAVLRSALSMKFQNRELVVLENFDLPEIKTKAFDSIVKKLGLVKPLIVYSGENRSLDLSSRNVANVKALKSQGLNVYDVLNHKSLVLTKGSLESIQGVLS